MDELLKTISAINSGLSDYVLTFLLVGVGIYFTIRTRFIQIRCFKEGWERAFGKFSLHGQQQKGLSSFQALSAAIAAQVGTGNIVGAAGAILTGGPGAIFWMWLIAFFGMATIYAEAVLAQETKIVDADGTIHGGPVYYIKRAFPNLFGCILACFFAIAIIISLGFMGCMVQANSIGETCQYAFKIPSWQIGIVIAILSAVIFIGGVSRLVQVTEKLVPIMACLYLLGCVLVLICRIQYLPDTIVCIFKYAFMPEALIGGGFGYALKTAISQGVKRGLFSNEAGMGSTPHAHAIANVKHPHDQGTVAMIGVFIDTCVVLTMTALIIISTIYTGDGPLANATGANYHELLANSGLTKTNLAQHAIASVTTTNIGNIFVAICLLFFAFSTIITWNYFGKINFHYLFGKKATVLYSILSIVSIYLGTIMKNDLVWEFQDMFNQLMVFPNVIALVALAGIVVLSSKQHTAKEKTEKSE
ncbi:MAG: sodium:alanine symporter family protein [Lentisphaeria bacterium]|nr:sodium:alanine symporter family protein [Lentisphaeria bacterium]